MSSAPGQLVATSAGASLLSGSYVAADGGWAVEVDNDKNDHIDFVVHASAHEARALMAGL